MRSDLIIYSNSKNKNTSTGSRTLVLGFKVRCPCRWTTEVLVLYSNLHSLSICSFPLMHVIFPVGRRQCRRHFLQRNIVEVTLQSDSLKLYSYFKLVKFEIRIRLKVAIDWIMKKQWIAKTKQTSIQYLKAWDWNDQLAKQAL